MEQFKPQHSSLTAPTRAQPHNMFTGLDLLAQAASTSAPAPLSELDDLDLRNSGLASPVPEPLSESEIIKNVKKGRKPLARDVIWTAEMEVDLLQFVMGSGIDVRDYYKYILEFFAEKYNIHTDEAELKKRFTHLRGVQKAVLEKFGRPLPGPVKYAKKKKKKKSKKVAADDGVDEVLRRVKRARGDGGVRGTKRTWEDMEEDEDDMEVDGLLALLEAAKQNGDVMD